MKNFWKKPKTGESIADEEVVRLKSIKEVLQKKKYHPEFYHFKDAHLGNLTPFKLIFILIRSHLLCDYLS